MSQPPRQFFSLHELLVMAALAALGGVSGAAVSNIRAAMHSVIVIPVGAQPAAGVHVLWLVLAVGLVRKPGAATITGVLKGSVELLSGSPLGLPVMAYCVVAGVTVDLVWLLLARRHHVLTFILAGGAGTASNVLVLSCAASLNAKGQVSTALTTLAFVAFASGTLLAGVLGWWLLRTLHTAGVIGTLGMSPAKPTAGRRWTDVGYSAAAVALTIAVIYLASSRADAPPNSPSPDPETSSIQSAALP